MFNHFALFLAASWILIITPGPDMIYVMTRGISQGRKAGVISALGVTLGILVHTLFASLGLACILMTSALAFMIVKLAGACYLVFLGIKMVRTRGDMIYGQDSEVLKLRSVFIQGILSNVLNPKVALFFLAFLPQFVNPEAGSSSLQMMGMGICFAFFGLVFLAVLGYF
jgi:threonine/homoserine/homoserine lactone efflux protein